MDQLSDDQMDKLRQFQDIANLEEMELAVVTLASCDWNLEHAIEAHLGGNPPVNREPQLNISAMDYVRDFPEEAMMVDAEEQMDVRPPPRFRAAHTRAAAAAAAAAASDESMASSSSGRTALAAAAPVPTRVEQRATRPTTRSTATATAASSVVVPVAAAPAASVADPADSPAVPPAVPAANNAAVRMQAGYSSAEESDDEDYDYAMEEQPEDEQPVRVLATNGGAARGSSDFGVPLIPTDCASALEGTQNFQSVFEARYGKDRGHLMPPFFVGTLQSAIREAFDCPDRPVSERRPLALYIHHDGSVARNIFPQAVLCSSEVIALLRSQFIVWPWDVTAKQNEEKLTTWLTECSLYDARPVVASFLTRGVDSLPLLILLSKDGGQLRMIDFVKGSESADQAMEKLLMCMDAYATSKISLEKQEQERQERELLRKEQERELQESLAVDRERAERQAREIREAKEAEERVAKEKEEKDAHIAALKSSLPEEPAEGTPNCCAVRFRLPEQGVALRRFSKSSPLSVVLQFLESEGFPVSDYRFMNSDFPQKKDITQWEAKSTLAELKFPEREVINVEER